jgi:hypothetical protein
VGRQSVERRRAGVDAGPPSAREADRDTSRLRDQPAAAVTSSLLGASGPGKTCAILTVPSQPASQVIAPVSARTSQPTRTCRYSVAACAAAAPGSRVRPGGQRRGAWHEGAAAPSASRCSSWRSAIARQQEGRRELSPPGVSHVAAERQHGGAGGKSGREDERVIPELDAPCHCGDNPRGHVASEPVIPKTIATRYYPR